MNFSRQLITYIMGFIIAFVPVAIVSLTIPGIATAAEDDVDEIIVTARKRDESLQEVPLAITAFTAEDIEAQGLTDARDLADAVAGLVLTSDFGRTNDRPSIRGISNIRAETDQPVAGFVDGVFLSGQGLLSSGLNIVERVEVVKGPQSALYGRSTFAGAINFITKKPTKAFEADLKLNLAQHGEEDIAVSFSGPISDTLGFLVAARSYDFDGDYDIGATPEYNRIRAAGGVVDLNMSGEAGEESSKNFFGKLSFTPTERISVDVTYAYEEIDDGAPRIALSDLGDNNLFNFTSPADAVTRTTGAPGKSPGVARPNYYIQGDVPNPGAVSAITSLFAPFGGIGIRRDSHRISGIFDLEINDQHAVKYIVSYYDEDEVRALDQSYTGLQSGFGGAASWGSYDESEFQSISHEVRLASTYDEALNLLPNDGPLNWLLGFYYYEDDIENIDIKHVIRQTRADMLLDYTEDSSTIAVFGSLEYEFIRDLTASVEVRWFEEEVDRVDADRSGFSGATRGPNVSRPTVKFDDITTRYTLDYQFTDDILFYGLYSQGFKRGGLNGLDAQRAAIPGLGSFDPETIDNYEIGIKTQWPDYGLTLNLAAYRMDWTDLQLSQSVVTADAQVTAVANVGDAEINGLEADLKWQPDRHWTVAGSVALVDPEFKNGCEVIHGQFSSNRCPDGSNNASIAGNEVPRVSKEQYNVTVAYDSDNIWHGHAFFGRIDASFQSGRWAHVQNLASTGDSFKVNLRTGIVGDKYTVTFFVDNATDEDTPVNLFRYIDVARFSSATNRNVAAFLPAKRQFGVTLQYNF